METVVTRFRDGRSPVAVAYSTKDRVDLTRRTVDRLLDDPRIDLFWMDGSATQEGRALPGELMPGRPAATALHHGVVGGPDSAILYALMTLRDAGYRWIVLVENDVLLDEGWFEALFAAAEAAGRDGFEVGGLSARVIPNRVLSFNGDYALLYNAGAGFVALTHEAAGIVIDHYRTTDLDELQRHVLNLTGRNIHETWGPEWSPGTNILLCADWAFDMALYMHGKVVAAPPVSLAHNIDPGHVMRFVATADDHLDAARGAVPHGARLRRPTRPDIRFQRSLVSDLRLAGCHQLRLNGSADDPGPRIALAGDWTRRWLQFLGPFELFGTGSITVDLLAGRLALLAHARTGKAVLEISGGSGARQRLEVDPPAKPLPIVEIGLDPFDHPRGTVTVTVLSGAIGLIGLCMERDLLPFYTKARPDFDFLAL